MIKKLDRKPLLKRYIECLGLNHEITKMGAEYFGSTDDIEMLKNSVFDLQYQGEEKGRIKRLLIPTEKKQVHFSQSYETIRFFQENKDGL